MQALPRLTAPDTEIVEGELVPYEPPPLTLFGTSDPRVALERMADVAAVLVDVIKSRKLFARIGGGEHITAEGWTTLGGMRAPHMPQTTEKPSVQPCRRTRPEVPQSQ